MESVWIGMPSPLPGSVVSFLDLLQLPTQSERLQVIFSETKIVYQGYTQRKIMTRWVLDCLVTMCGGTCYVDPSMKSCRTAHDLPARYLADLEFDHMPGYTKIRHVTDYKHNAKPEFRLGLLHECLLEAQKCKAVCFLHHHRRHSKKVPAPP